jgi:hypothetical protein
MTETELTRKGRCLRRRASGFGRVVALVQLPIVLTLLVASCGGSKDTGPLAILPGKWDGGDDALAEGTLRLEDGCLLIDNGRLQLLIAVHRDGVSWNEERLELRISGESYRVGETVEFGGGMSRPASQIEWAVPPAENCTDYETWIVAGR